MESEVILAVGSGLPPSRLRVGLEHALHASRRWADGHADATVTSVKKTPYRCAGYRDPEAVYDHAVDANEPAVMFDGQTE